MFWDEFFWDVLLGRAQKKVNCLTGNVRCEIEQVNHCNWVNHQVYMQLTLTMI